MYYTSMFYQDSLKNSLIATKTTLPSILDMCYLSGKIYEDPQKNTGLTCSLPEGTKIFENCSDLHTNWDLSLKEYEKDKLKSSFDSIKFFLKKKKDEFTQSAFNSATSGIAGLPSPIISDMRNSITRNIEKDKIEIKENIHDVNGVEFMQSTGFKIALYINSFYNCSVLAIRGTEMGELMNVVTDLRYVFHMSIKMYEQAIDFYNYVLCLPIIKQYPLVACTGHSLGGIVAKMLAPITGLSTYTFNSPGVLKMLKDYPKGLRLGQEVLTFIANGDIVGNFNWQDDLGSVHDHIFLPVLNSSRIPYSSLKDDLTLHGGYYFSKTFFSYHSIIDMFYFLKTSKEARNYRIRNIVYVS